jgi:hypothetical protein
MTQVSQSPTSSSVRIQPSISADRWRSEAGNAAHQSRDPSSTTVNNRPASGNRSRMGNDYPRSVNSHSVMKPACGICTNTLAMPRSARAQAAGEGGCAAAFTSHPDRFGSRCQRGRGAKSWISSKFHSGSAALTRRVIAIRRSPGCAGSQATPRSFQRQGLEQHGVVRVITGSEALHT